MAITIAGKMINTQYMRLDLLCGIAISGKPAAVRV